MKAPDTGVTNQARIILAGVVVANGQDLCYSGVRIMSLTRTISKFLGKA